MSKTGCKSRIILSSPLNLTMPIPHVVADRKIGRMFTPFNHYPIMTLIPQHLFALTSRAWLPHGTVVLFQPRTEYAAFAEHALIIHNITQGG